jgi:hypothetical protein
LGSDLAGRFDGHAGVWLSYVRRQDIRPEYGSVVDGRRRKTIRSIPRILLDQRLNDVWGVLSKDGKQRDGNQADKQNERP